MSWSVQDPTGDLSLVVALENGLARYSLSRNDEVVVAGDLGVELDTVDLRADLSVTGVERRTLTSAFSLPHGKTRSATAAANELTLTLADADGHELVIVARAYSDGVALRYVLPGAGRRSFRSEATTVEFERAGQAWIQPTDVANEVTPAYEALHAAGVPIGQRRDVPSWNLPALFRSGEHHVLVTESDTDATFHGSHLDPIPDRPAYRWVGPQAEEGRGVGDRLPTHDGDWTLPWRVLVLGDLATVIETDLVRLLARPGRPDADWIRPGKVSWSWWSDHDSPKNPGTLRRFVELAAEMGWQHTLIDANWNLNDEAEIRALIDDARALGIGVFLWYNSGGPNNTVTEQPRDKMFDAEVRRAELAKLADWGVAGVKVDFWHSDKAESNGRYLTLAADAYDAGLMVNFHGCTIPRGWEVAFPNIMTMEGVRGAEQYSFDERYPEDAPWLNTILAVTRNVVGSMDYTPVTFSDVAFPHRTTNAHELALAVVFESALGHFADSADSYLAQTAEVRDFLRRVPVVWDELRFVAGRPGTHVVLARRLGDDWWVGGINGTDDEMRLELDLADAGEGPARLFSDAGPRRIAVRDVDLDGVLDVTMAPRGGFALAPTVATEVSP